MTLGRSFLNFARSHRQTQRGGRANDPLPRIRLIKLPQYKGFTTMPKRRLSHAQASEQLRNIREDLQRLKEQCEPLSYGLAQQLNICLHSLRTAELDFSRHYRPEED